MLNMWGSTGIMPDYDEVFYDGFLYIIRRVKKGYITDSEEVEPEYAVEVKCLNAEYDEPWTLEDIASEYPDVIKVIFEDALKGKVYNYGNHTAERNGTAEKWEKVGETLGYA